MPGELIVVVDDDAAVRASLAALLETAGYETIEFASGSAFLDSVHELAGACVLLDIKMPGLDGLEVQRRLNRLGAKLPVVLVTGHGDIPMAVQAMRAGASDFLEKPVRRDRLTESVARALREAPGGPAGAQERAAMAARIDTLSPREREVLVQLVMGRPNKVAAFELGISPRTVEVYRRNVMTKTGARSLPHLVRLALVAGIDPLGEPAPGARRRGPSRGGREIAGQQSAEE